jgi:hypothetical protein
VTNEPFAPFVPQPLLSSKYIDYVENDMENVRRAARGQEERFKWGKDGMRLPLEEELYDVIRRAFISTR